MGVIRRSPDDPKTPRCYIADSGAFIAGTKGFTSLTGYVNHDLAGRHAGALFADPGHLNQLLAAAVSEAAESGMNAMRTTVVSKFGERIPATVVPKSGGGSTTRILFLEMRPEASEVPGAVVDGSGEVIHVNGALEDVAGSAVCGRKLWEMLAEPHGSLLGGVFGGGAGTKVAFDPRELDGRVLGVKGRTGKATSCLLSVKTIDGGGKGGDSTAMVSFDILGGGEGNR